MRWLRGLVVLAAILRFGGVELAMIALLILVIIAAVRTGREPPPEPAPPPKPPRALKPPPLRSIQGRRP